LCIKAKLSIYKEKCDMFKPGRNKILISVILSLISFALILIFSEYLFECSFDKYEAKLYDWRYQKKIDRSLSRVTGAIDNIVIIDIDQRTLDKLGPISTWENKLFVQVINDILRSGSLVTGLDMPVRIATNGDATGDSLISLFSKHQSLCKAVHMIEEMPYLFYNFRNDTSELKILEKHSINVDAGLIANLPAADLMNEYNYDLYQAAKRIGGVLIQEEHGDVIRSTPLLIKYRDRVIPSFPLSVVMSSLHLERDKIRFQSQKHIKMRINGSDYILIPLNESEKMILNFHGALQTFRHISFIDILEKNIDLGLFRDKIVLIGTTSNKITSGINVPFQNDFSVIEMHANAICSIIAGTFISKLNSYIFYSILFLVILMTVTSLIIWRRFWGTVVTILVAGLCVFLSVELLKYGDMWLNIMKLVGGVLFGFVTAMVYHTVMNHKTRYSLRNYFKHYISDENLRALIKKSDSIDLQGDRRVATSFFCNIKDFIQLVENLSPHELVKILDQYLSEMSEIIIRNNGYIDKYEGDGLFAIWGAPLKHERHAIDACSAALDMQAQIVALRNSWKRNELPQFKMQIGIDTGHIVLGNIGGSNRFDYTAIGDAVNIAYRLESANKLYDTEVIISENTFKVIQDNFWVRELDYIRVKGNKNPIKIYELISRKSEQIDQARSSGYEYFLQGLSYYRQRDWVNAYNYFYKAIQLIPQDGPSKEFIRRCKIFIEEPRPEDWDGVFNLRSR